MATRKLKTSRRNKAQREPVRFVRAPEAAQHDSLPLRSGALPTHSHVQGAPAQRALPPLAAGDDQLLYLDAGSGLAGDMLLAALIDLGVPERLVTTGLAGLALTGYTTHVRPALRSGIAAKRFEVLVTKRQPSRDHATIVKLIQGAKTLSEGARAIALAAFARLADAEAQIHGTTPDKVHFHEVGAVDSIVDIVGAAIAFDHMHALGVRIVCSPLPMGRGFTRSAHGVIPLPAPATVLCLAGVPTYDAGSEGEFVTPTGACLVATVADAFTGWPAFHPERVGFGAGTKEFPDRANVLRVVLGKQASAPETSHDAQQTSHVVIEANVDDMSPEIAAYALSRALEAGALDAWSIAIGMKKSRPGLTLSALAPRENFAEVARMLLSETTTLGVRYYGVDRIERPRSIHTVTTRFGEIAVKVAAGDDLPETVAPEFEDCRRAAIRHSASIREVYAAALSAYRTKQADKQASPSH